MASNVTTVEQYIDELTPDRKLIMQHLRQVLSDNLPTGFEEVISYGMIGYVVPHSIYPQGYHCNTKLPLPFIALASQKNFIAIYHMGIYADLTLYDWFIEQYPKYATSKLDIGKSCMRFKKMDDIPFELIKLLVKKMTPQQWIALYERQFKR